MLNLLHLPGQESKFSQLVAEPRAKSLAWCLHHQNLSRDIKAKGMDFLTHGINRGTIL